ncbi:MAG: hypothetical protein ACJ786_06020 [Catenulispora sp.]
MSHEPEHEENLHEETLEDLHDALGDQVEYLEIGPSPIAEVMKDGRALRARRRMALVSGVAALAVLPVAAVAVFGGGGGGSRATVASLGNGAARTGGTGWPSPTPGSTAVPDRTGGPTSAAKPRTLLSSPAVTLSKPTEYGTPSPPNARDDIKVLADGTFGGQHWRLVRDRFVVAQASADNASPGFDDHLPLSQRGRAGTYTCEFTGLQWGDRSAGTTPDFNSGGMCGPDNQAIGYSEIVARPSLSTLTGTDFAVADLVGRVDATKVATVTITVGDAISSPEPVYTVDGERIGYYVFFERAATAASRLPATVTGYGAQGEEVGHADLDMPVNLR